MWIDSEGADVHEGKHLPAESEGKGYDKDHEECHLCYEQEEDLGAIVLAVSSPALSHIRAPWCGRNAAALPEIGLSTYKTVVERHLDRLNGFALRQKDGY